LNLRELWYSVVGPPAQRRGRTGAYPALREDSLALTAVGRRPALGPLGVLGGLLIIAGLWWFRPSAARGRRAALPGKE
jgi:hypothetical protein